MKAEQLIKIDCADNSETIIAPITKYDAVIDKNGVTLSEGLKIYNHIYLAFTEYSKAKTRCQVPSDMRRKGLWITYTSCQGKITTEYYKGDSFTDTEWGKSSNWVDYMDKSYIQEVIDSKISWYKA